MVKPIKFSIIVPIYNMERYLERCLNSILGQDYSEYEVICINDGSTDCSQQILERFEKKDSRILVVNKSNGGLGMARNTGLELATGEYVWFVDSDDWLKKEALTSISNKIEQTNHLSAYVIDMIQTDDKTYQRVVQSCSREDGELSSIRYAKDIMLYNALFFAQNKIYRYDVIKDYSFNTGFYEDVPQIVLFGKNDFNVYIMHEALYYYYSRPDSIMKTIDNRVLDMFYQTDTVYDNLYPQKDFQLYCTHLFYYAMTRTCQTIKDAHKKELLTDYNQKFKERKNKYKNPLWLLVFNELPLRRKIKLFVEIIKNRFL